MDIADLRACLEPGMRSRKSLEFPVPPVRGDEFAGASPWQSRRSRPALNDSVCSEAIIEPGTAGALEIVLGATAARPTRRMR